VTVPRCIFTLPLATGRPRADGEGRHRKLYARTAYSYTDKLRAIKLYDEDGRLDVWIDGVFGEVSDPLNVAIALRRHFVWVPTVRHALKARARFVAGAWPEEA
jgi:hypothetical protein